MAPGALGLRMAMAMLLSMRCKDACEKIHPARFPAARPEFFIKLLTDEADIVLDPFAGSNTTGAWRNGWSGLPPGRRQPELPLHPGRR
jgi:hypothetical protein